MESDIENHAAYRIVEFLVRVSEGRSPGEKNKRGYYPFTAKPGQSTQPFKQCPFTWFAHALTTAYPFIRADRDKWEQETSKTAHPMNATGLWLLPVIKRYTKFFKLFRTKLTRLFESYEEQEGEYHGNESAPATVSGRGKR